MADDKKRLKFVVNEMETHSRSVQVSIALSEASETVVIVGATRHDNCPWPEPRLSFGSSLYLSEEQTIRVMRAVVELFLEYGRRFPRGG
jgi:hypothetical protein